MQTVSVLLPVIILNKWQLHLTEACVKTLIDCTDYPFELVIIETINNQLYHLRHLERCRVKYINRKKRTNLVNDLNAGMQVATGNVLVHTANDIFVRENWLEALIEPFEKYNDCGVSTLASVELNHVEASRIVEAVGGGALMAFRNIWKFDPQFVGPFSDSDIIMQAYNNGYRMYRNHKTRFNHFQEMTYQTLYNKQERKDLFEKSKGLFIKKHGGSPLMAFRALMEGWRM